MLSPVAWHAGAAKQQALAAKPPANAAAKQAASKALPAGEPALERPKSADTPAKQDVAALQRRVRALEVLGVACLRDPVRTSVVVFMIVGAA